MIDYRQLVEDNYRLVWSVVNRFNYLKQEKEDLFQSGVVGLIMAAKKYDEAKGFQFSTFAMPYILGEIKNYLREKNHFKVSKQTLRMSKSIKQILEQNQHISIKNLAKTLGLSYEDCLLGYNLSQHHILSLDQEIEDNLTLGSVALSDERYTVRKEKLLLDELYQALSPLEQQIFTYRFYYGLTQCEVGMKLNISQSKVSRLEKQITKKLYQYLQTS